MSWQDELQQLDSALAAGQLSADDYRVRRDAILSRASGQSTDEAPSSQPSLSERTQVVRPVSPPAVEHTQVVSNQTGHAERTQVVSAHDPSADSTQIVSSSATGAPRSQGFPALPPPPPWESARPNMSAPAPVAPPWGGSDDLPVGFGQANWPSQGPEVFAESEKSGAGKIIAIALVALLVVGGVGAAVWFFALKPGGGPEAGPSQTTQTTTSSQKPVLPPPNIPKGPFIEIPGKEALNRTLPIDQAVTRKLPTEKEAALMQANQIVEVGGLVTEENGLRRGIWAFKVAEGGDAKAALTAMDKLYEQSKFVLETSSVPGVSVRKQAAASPDAITVIRAHFVTEGGYMVRVEAFGKDAAAVQTGFADLLAEETAKFPPLP